MAKFFTATDATGKVHTRSSATRTYTHCVVFRAAGDYVSKYGPQWNMQNGALLEVRWAGSRLLAQKSRMTYHSATPANQEIVEAVEVDGATYRQAKAKKKGE